jgi:DNA polymerase-3 subunit gamma/tau
VALAPKPAAAAAKPAAPAPQPVAATPQPPASVQPVADTAKPAAEAPKPAVEAPKPAPAQSVASSAKPRKFTQRRFEDARHCLDKGTNTEVIKCAEAYL